jgi:hypothetical protein
MEKLNDGLWKSWADNWDKKNPSNFVKACADSKARQEEHAQQQKQKQAQLEKKK